LVNTLRVLIYGQTVWLELGINGTLNLFAYFSYSMATSSLN